MGIEREDAYDEFISPLMNEIIQLCQKYKIPMVATFELDVPEDGAANDPLMCTTILADEEKVGPIRSERLKEAAKNLRPDSPIVLTTIIMNAPDGSKKIIVGGN